MIFSSPSDWFKTNQNKSQTKTIANIPDERKPQPKPQSTNPKVSKRSASPATLLSGKQNREKVMASPQKVTKMVTQDSRAVSRQPLKPPLPLAQASKV